MIDLESIWSLSCLSVLRESRTFISGLLCHPFPMDSLPATWVPSQHAVIGEGDAYWLQVSSRYWYFVPRDAFFLDQGKCATNRIVFSECHKKVGMPRISYLETNSLPDKLGAVDRTRESNLSSLAVLKPSARGPNTNCLPWESAIHCWLGTGSPCRAQLNVKSCETTPYSLLQHEWILGGTAGMKSPMAQKNVTIQWQQGASFSRLWALHCWACEPPIATQRRYLFITYINKNAFRLQVEGSMFRW